MSGLILTITNLSWGVVLRAINSRIACSETRVMPRHLTTAISRSRISRQTSRGEQFNRCATPGTRCN